VISAPPADRHACRPAPVRPRTDPPARGRLCAAAGLTCSPSPESALSGRPGQRGGRAKSAPEFTQPGVHFGQLPPPGAQARPGRAGSALGDRITKNQLFNCPPLFIQQNSSTAGPRQLKYDFKHSNYLKRKKNNICVLEHLFPRAADIT